MKQVNVLGWSTWGSKGLWLTCALSHSCRGRAQQSGMFALPWLPVECQLVVPVPCHPGTLLSLAYFGCVCSLMYCSSPICCSCSGLVGSLRLSSQLSLLALCLVPRAEAMIHFPHCCIKAKAEPQWDLWSGSWAALLTELNSSSLQALHMPQFPQSLKWKFYLLRRAFGQLSLQVL